MSISTNLTFFRGEDIALTFTLSPLQDITGWTIVWKLADRSGSVILTKSATLVVAVTGTFKVTIDSADTAALSMGLYLWDCRREDVGAKATLADGYLFLRQEVTA
jgi:hypothetical protein